MYYLTDKTSVTTEKFSLPFVKNILNFYVNEIFFREE
jgi:hypothetical protein